MKRRLDLDLVTTFNTGEFMKRLLLALALTLSFNLSAATTGTLLLQGIVLPIRSITVTPTSAAASLDLSTTATNLKVATVNERSNSILGYKITITSANLSNLKRSAGPEVFPYTLRYNGIVAPVTTVAGYSVSYGAGLVNVNRDLEISYTGVQPETMVEGTYADTLTLSIAAP